MKVEQWSFCTKCKGQGCGACDKTGVVVELIELEQLPPKVKEEYLALQKEVKK